MSTTPEDPVLSAIIRAVTQATGGRTGLLLRAEGRVLRVVAAAGPIGWDVVGEPISVGEGVAGYVAAAGQPLMLSGDTEDPRLGEGTASLLGRNPGSVLAVPVQGRDRLLGVIELMDAADGFDMEDAEQATLHAGVAAVALADARLTGMPDVPEPAELAAELRRLEATDPTRYAIAAAVVQALAAR